MLNIYASYDNIVNNVQFLYENQVNHHGQQLDFVSKMLQHLRLAFLASGMLKKHPDADQVCLLPAVSSELADNELRPLLLPLPRQLHHDCLPSREVVLRVAILRAGACAESCAPGFQQSNFYSKDF